MADAKRRRLSQRLKDTRFSGVSSAGEVGLRDTARGFEDKYPAYDTYGTPLSKGAIAAGEKKMREKANLLRDKEEVDKGAAKAAREAGAEERREARGMKKGGSVNENKMMKKMGRGLTKAAMQKVASKVVKGHEKRMHKKYEGGGSVSARADGCAQRGKTKGRMV